ncbi:DUF378 domain-containing protein [candidate division WWE3 bacterium CG_4_9_14_0_2_um_filter_35_11]|uniref:DUF378 domain-containing protein n=1 Tax=candidate division WWE3 bacterium CG_4_9_14_0_2_um_filter_35_11 TaxID=1975077 RepID=A0A2M8EML0_UNCKA|nr:MAG: DUF378 domain-containing protein [candidate division WWE3 bacterium CG10_big_fil_rev_8_21_14_0_10_35_32]PJC23984.1 MAG: DUF378 domain-containing protein [candidate division WWE3 bacterium CG_4_9_14_0_2_um_filter_35_11]
MKEIHMLTFTMVIVGALNWGLVGALNINLVNMLFGGFASLETVIYLLVGVSAIAEVIMHANCCKWCALESSKSKKGKK